MPELPLHRANPLVTYSGFAPTRTVVVVRWQIGDLPLYLARDSRRRDWQIKATSASDAWLRRNDLKDLRFATRRAAHETAEAVLAVDPAISKYWDKSYKFVREPNGSWRYNKTIWHDSGPCTLYLTREGNRWKVELVDQDDIVVDSHDVTDTKRQILGWYT